MLRRKRKRKILSAPRAIALAALAYLSCLHADSSSPPARENWLGPHAAFWTFPPERFIRETREAGFRWLEENTAAQATPLRGTVFGKPMSEAVVRFQNNTPHTFTGFYFHRGENDERLSEEDFQNLVRETMATISKRVRRRPMPGTNTSRRSRVRDASQVWQLDTHRFELAYSYSPPRRESGRNLPFRAEYVRLTVSKFQAGDIPAHASTRVNIYQIRENIQRDPESGDVWIHNVPMVDQGPRGYCAAATAERVMLYFGQDVDQHQVAQIANTSSERGTSIDDFKTALEAVARQYSYSLNTHIDWSFRDFQRMIDDYNREARNREAREFNFPRGAIINVTAVYQAMNPDILVTGRQRRRADFNRFKERIETYVDGGAPLIWGVMLGVIPEQGLPQAAGGHLRLIIGYNSETDELIYTDSWGRGHERKRMPLDQAFAITAALYSLEPRGLRIR